MRLKPINRPHILSTQASTIITTDDVMTGIIGSNGGGEPTILKAQDFTRCVGEKSLGFAGGELSQAHKAGQHGI